MLGYVTVLLALRPPAQQLINRRQRHEEHHSKIGVEEQPPLAAAAAVVLQLDLKMDAPIIVMPRSSDSNDKVSVHNQ